MKSLPWMSVAVCLMSVVLISQTGPTLTVSAAPGQGVPFDILQQQVDLIAGDLESSHQLIADLQTQLENTTDAFETLQSRQSDAQEQIAELNTQLQSTTDAYEALQSELSDARELIAEQNATLETLRSRMLFDDDGTWIGWTEMTFEGPALFQDPVTGAAVAIHGSENAILSIDPAPLAPTLAALSVVGEAQFWSTTDPVEPTVKLNGLRTRDPLIEGILTERAVVEIHGGLISANTARDTAFYLNFLEERPLTMLVTGSEAGTKYEAFHVGVPDSMRPNAFLQTHLIRAHEFLNY